MPPALAARKWAAGYMLKPARRIAVEASALETDAARKRGARLYGFSAAAIVVTTPAGVIWRIEALPVSAT